MKLLIKSNSDLEEYLKKNKKKKVMFDENANIKNKDENNNNEFKRSEKKKRTFLDKERKIKDYFSDLNIDDNNKRKSFIDSLPKYINLNPMNSRKGSKKEIDKISSKINLPNLQDKSQLNNSGIKRSSKNKKSNKSIVFKDIKDSKTISFKESEDNLNPIEQIDTKLLEEKESNKSIIKEKKSSHSILKNKENKENIKSSESNSDFIEKNIKDIYQKININKKPNIIKRRNNQKNIHIKGAVKAILSELNEKEKKLTKSTSNLNRTLIYFKKTNENLNTIKANKTGNFQFKCLNNSSKNSNSLAKNNMITPVKKIGLMFKQINENNSQFHFPLINKIFYQDKKGKIDMIDRIKFSLKHEYSEKLKEKKMNRRAVDGHEIINKLNDQYELEKLFEIAEILREKRRKEASYDIFY